MNRYTFDYNDIVGKRYGQIFIENFVRCDKSKSPYKYYYRCKCDCGVIKEVVRTNIITGHTKSCGCLRNKRGKLHNSWNGYEKISGRHFSSIKRHAKERNLLFSITIEDAWSQYVKQNGMCLLSGLPLKLEEDKEKINLNNYKTASLDRIDNSKGYMLGNIQWLHKDINWMKGKFKQDDFISLCKLVANKNINKL